MESGEKRVSHLRQSDKPVFEPLDAEIYKGRCDASFPAVYLTLISIIQGVALGILATQTHEYMRDQHDYEAWIRFAPYSIISFFLIAVTVQLYAWFTGIFRWRLRFWDIFHPLHLGFWEILSVFYLTNPKWWVLFIALWGFAGGWVLFDLLRQCKPEMFISIPVFEKVTGAVRRDMRWAFGMVGVLIIVWIYLPLDPSPCIWHWSEIIVFLILSIGGIFLPIFAMANFEKGFWTILDEATQNGKTPKPPEGPTADNGSTELTVDK